MDRFRRWLQVPQWNEEVDRGAWWVALVDTVSAGLGCVIQILEWLGGLL